MGRTRDCAGRKANLKKKHFLFWFDDWDLNVIEICIHWLEKGAILQGFSAVSERPFEDRFPEGMRALI